MLAIMDNIVQLDRSDLGELALDAAIESEDILSGNAHSTDAISLFVKRIQESIVGNNENKSLSDVTLTPIYYRALASTTGMEFEDTHSLIDTLSSVLDEIEINDSDKLSAGSKFRDFCLAMHSALINTTLPSRDNTLVP